MKETFICSECGNRVDEPRNRAERRIDYRCTHNDARIKTVHLARICRSCAVTEAEDIRSGKKEVVIVVRETSQQESLI